MAIVTCEQLASIIEPSDARCGVLVLVKDGGVMQLVTYGRTAADKAEAHDLKEWIKDEVFDGAAPEPIVHESFILDAAKNKERADHYRAALEQIAAAMAHGNLTDNNYERQRIARAALSATGS